MLSFFQNLKIGQNRQSLIVTESTLSCLMLYFFFFFCFKTEYYSLKQTVIRYLLLYFILIKFIFFFPPKLKIILKVTECTYFKMFGGFLSSITIFSKPKIKVMVTESTLKYLILPFLLLLLFFSSKTEDYLW